MLTTSQPSNINFNLPSGFNLQPSSNNILPPPSLSPISPTLPSRIIGLTTTAKSSQRKPPPQPSLTRRAQRSDGQHPLSALSICINIITFGTVSPSPLNHLVCSSIPSTRSQSSGADPSQYSTCSLSRQKGDPNRVV